MKIRSTAWQQVAADNVYKVGRQAGVDKEQDKDERQMQAADDRKGERAEAARDPLTGVPGEDPPASGGNKIKSSVPSDNVAQLASELANCQTKLDVQQVSSKAMRALASLQMSGALSEGKDKEKITQMIRRMKKLIKRVRTKLKNLTKEEELESRRKRAEEKRKEQEAQQLKAELQSKRNKRHRDERDYAMKEAARAGQETVADSVLPGLGKGMPAMPSGTGVSVPVTAAEAVSVDAGTALEMESVSLDVTV